MGVRKRQPVQAIAKGQLGVIGMAIFSAAGGAISKLTMSGVVASVTRSSAGNYLVGIYPAQQFYVPMIVGTTDGNAVAGAINGTTFGAVTPTSVTMILAMTSVTTADHSYVGILIFGFDN